MTAFDYVVLAIVGCSLLLGLWRGVVGEIIALAAWVLAFFAARMFGAEVGQALFSGTIADGGLRVVAGCAAVFVGVLVLMALARLAAQGLLKALGLSLTDRLLGVLFGIGRGVLIALVLVAAGGMTALPKQPWWINAKLSPPLETAVLVAKPWLPQELSKRIRFR